MQGSGVLFNPNGQNALEAIDADLLARCVSSSWQGCIVAVLGPNFVRTSTYHEMLQPHDLAAAEVC